MNINSDIAKTYTLSGRKQTMVAILGVLLGMAVYMFMNSMNAGFNRTSNESFFKSTPHLRIYSDDQISEPLQDFHDAEMIIINPKIVPNTAKINDPQAIATVLSKQAEVMVVVPQVAMNVFYNNGKSQINGKTVGFEPAKGNEMFNIKSFMVQGDFDNLSSVSNGIVIGAGIAAKMSLETGDNLSITSSRGVNRVLKIVGIFQTNNSVEDKTKSYVSLSTAQQLMKESNAFVSDINVNFFEFNKAKDFAAKYSDMFGYKAEDWQAANEAYMAASRMRTIVITFVSLTLLLVSGFGIYNILNMTVSQKINDIAILKAMGFRGNDVIRIFVTQAMTVGVIGVALGISFAIVLINIMKHVYVGGDIGYFPIRFEPVVFIRGTIIGLVITFLAGYIPARKAARVDPVSIFRK
jgi:lipoprotein-releasing system permease protein